MIDINLIRENPKLVISNTKNRGYNFELVKEAIKIDEKWRKYKKQDDDLRAERNKISREISESKKLKDEKKASLLMKKAKEIADNIKHNEEKEDELKKELDDILSRLPNIQAEDVPVGGEEKNLPTHIALMNEECKQRIKEELPPELAAEVLKRSKVVGWTNYDNYAIIRESFSPQQRHNLMADLGLNPQAPLHLYFSNNIHPEAEYWGPYREWPAEKRKK